MRSFLNAMLLSDRRGLNQMLANLRPGTGTVMLERSQRAFNHAPVRLPIISNNARVAGSNICDVTTLFYCLVQEIDGSGTSTSITIPLYTRYSFDMYLL